MNERSSNRRGQPKRGVLAHLVIGVPTVAVVVLWIASSTIAVTQSVVPDARVAAGFLPVGTVDPEEPAGGPVTTGAQEAPTGFDNQTNGATSQSAFDTNRGVFDEVDEISNGLGPTYNAQSCRECHQNVVTGGASQVAELRAGRALGGKFFASPGGTLIEARAVNPDIVAYVDPQDNVRTFRISTNTLGDGFVECIANAALLRIRDAQPPNLQGTADIVPVLEANSMARIGRFGWKSQHASLLSFSGDAYLNEVGITNPLFPTENQPNGRSVGQYDTVPDPEDTGGDIRAFTDFMRATKAPSRAPISPDVTAGESVFTRIGCATCHTAAITTAAPGTPINGGTFTVPPELGNKVIHPYSDFLLHDVGTGDGIPVQPTSQFASTANQIRTAPLWGLRTRNRLMHDGMSNTYEDAIRRHAGQATVASRLFRTLSAADTSALLAFLRSL